MKNNLTGFTILLGFLFIGESVASLGKLPVPGAVIGMALLFGFLLWRGYTPGSVQKASQFLLGHLSLLFVPAGVGAFLSISQFIADWKAIVATLLVGTPATILVTAWILHRFENKPEDS